MSGHSKWSTIKRKKEVTDMARGKVFSKFSKAITVSVKQGGGPDPSTNYKLRIAMDQAKAANMPRGNIERAIKKAETSGELAEVEYECIGPAGINIIIVTATDNKNRTSQELKTILDRGGGRMSGPGSAAFNFESKGTILIKNKGNIDDQTLSLIDLGVEEIEEVNGNLEVYVNPSVLSEIKTKIERAGFRIVSYDFIKKPKTLLTVSDVSQAKTAVNLLDNLDDQEDVQKVYSNLDLDDEMAEKFVNA